ncbi:MAG: o-succinylbenzoate synthase [Balneolales bacterium]
MIQYHKYNLPFLKPFSTSAGVFLNREGIIIQGEIQGIHFIGEAAPLPGFSKETLEDISVFLTKNQSHIEHLFNEDYDLASFDEHCTDLQAPPSIRFALSSAMGGYLAQKRGLSLSRYLNSASPDVVPVNMTLGLIPVDNFYENIISAWKTGYHTFKFKAGIDFETELEVLKEARKMLPQARIRIDVNGAWKPAEAINNLQRLESISIEYCEQPVAADDLEGLAEVTFHSPIPIAADESVRDVTSANDIIKQKAANVLILKPMLIGTITDFVQITQLANEVNMGVTVTTSLESGIGRLATAHLAASLKQQHFAHGLATGQILKDDLVDDQKWIQNGVYNLSSKAGLGLDLPVF